jgi:hypothetical protein
VLLSPGDLYGVGHLLGSIHTATLHPRVGWVRTGELA